MPVCTQPKLRVNASSFKVDRQVKTLLEQGLSVYKVHADKFRKLKPTVIITQTQCEVCAVSESDVKAAVDQWLGANGHAGKKPAVVSLKPNCLADVWKDIKRVAVALGKSRKGQNVVTRLQKRMKTIKTRAQRLSERPSVAFIEWIEPLMTGGNWMPELIEMAGGINLFGQAGRHSPYLKWQDLVAKNPETIIIAPCGYDIRKTKQEIKALLRKPEWPGLKAVRANRVYLADGNQYFNRPGPRLVESLEILAEILHPQEFNFDHAGKGWQKV